MDLVDRLRSKPEDDSSVFGRALAMRGAESSYLLDTDPSEAEDHTRYTEIAPGAAVRALLKELQTQRHFGILTPSHLFSLLHRHMAVRRGALLVPYRDGGMVPIAAAGLDRTSTFRIRLLPEEQSWLGDGRHAVILDDSRREAITRRLSRKDASATPRIALLPFNHLRDVVAVLLIFDSPLLQMDPGVLDVIVGALSESGGRLLFDGRKRPLDQGSHSSIFQVSHMPSIIQGLRSRGTQEKRDVLIIEVELRSLIHEITEDQPHLDRTRLFEDILDTVALLTQGSHTAVFLGGTTVALCGLERPEASPALIVHLLTTTLGSLFGSSHPELLTYRLRDAEEMNSEPRDDQDP
jgi:hypothetical protein